MNFDPNQNRRILIIDDNRAIHQDIGSGKNPAQTHGRGRSHIIRRRGAADQIA